MNTVANHTEHMKSALNPWARPPEKAGVDRNIPRKDTGELRQREPRGSESCERCNYTPYNWEVFLKVSSMYDERAEKRGPSFLRLESLE